MKRSISISYEISAHSLEKRSDHATVKDAGLGVASKRIETYDPAGILAGTVVETPDEGVTTFVNARVTISVPFVGGKFNAVKVGAATILTLRGTGNGSSDPWDVPVAITRKSSISNSRSVQNAVNGEAENPIPLLCEVGPLGKTNDEKDCSS